MVVQAFAFYLFAGILLLSALMVITARNPVHSVLFLILAFFNAAGLFIMLGAEFLGLILVIVYVGAVAVLFLFVVMMLDINFAELRKASTQYIALGLVVGLILLSEFFILFSSWTFVDSYKQNIASPISQSEQIGNVEALGQILYTDYIFAFQVSGLILFVAMIGAIVLTHRKRPGIRKQNVSEQQARKASQVLEIVKVKPKTGV